MLLAVVIVSYISLCFVFLVLRFFAIHRGVVHRKRRISHILQKTYIGLIKHLVVCHTVLKLLHLFKLSVNILILSNILVVKLFLLVRIVFGISKHVYLVFLEFIILGICENVYLVFSLAFFRFERFLYDFLFLGIRKRAFFFGFFYVFLCLLFLGRFYLFGLFSLFNLFKRRLGLFILCGAEPRITPA